MEGNRVCSLCHREVAVQFCICSNLPLYCSGCKRIHQAKPDFHFALPLKALDYVTPKLQQQFKVHLLSLVNSHEKLRENLQVLEQFRGAIEATYENFHRDLDKAKANLLYRLEGWKTALSQNIEAAIQENDANAYRHDYQPSSYLAGLVWTHACQFSSDPIPVLAYEVRIAEERLKDPVDISFYLAIEGFGPYESGGRRLMREIETTSGKATEWERREEEQKSRIGKLETDLRKATETAKVGKNTLETNEFSQLFRPENSQFHDRIPPPPRPGLPKITPLSTSKVYRPPPQPSLCARCYKDAGSRLKRPCGCVLCSVCTTISTETCPACRAEEVRVKKVKSTKPFCACGKVIEDKGIYCEQRCVCAACLFRHCLETHSFECPTCHLDTFGIVALDVVCSWCCRRLLPADTDIAKHPCALCTCGAILCCFCIKLDSDSPVCPLPCRGALELLDPKLEIQEEQTNFPYACYCGRPETGTARTSCHHLVHQDCKNDIFSCRKCRTSLKPRPKAKLLGDYLDD